jgi:hypothetical protein
MTPVLNRSKRIYAEDVVFALIDQCDCNIDPESMSDIELFDWLEGLGYEWIAGAWILKECSNE